MENKKHVVNKIHSNANDPLTILAFEQLLAHYRKKVWEVQIAPTLIASNSVIK